MPEHVQIREGPLDKFMVGITGVLVFGVLLGSLSLLWRTITGSWGAVIGPGAAGLIYAAGWYLLGRLERRLAEPPAGVPAILLAAPVVGAAAGAAWAAVDPRFPLLPLVAGGGTIGGLQAALAYRKWHSSRSERSADTADTPAI